MFSRFVEKLSEITLPILEYGWVVAIPLGIIYLFFPNLLDNALVQLIIAIPIALVVITLALGITLGVGQFVFKHYSDQYDKLVSNGEDKTRAFVKTSLKAIIVFILLVLLALLVLLRNLSLEPNMV